MDKKTIVSIGIVLVGVIGAIIWWGLTSDKAAQDVAMTPVTEMGTVYFYGAECPHCKNINDFLEKNDVASKFSFTKKEVWHDKTNQKQMLEAAKICGLDTSKVGVPFVFDSNTCLIGEPEVKGFFAEKAGVNEE